MTVFGCRACGTTLTVPVSAVALPIHADQKYSNRPVPLPPALEPGTFAVEPLPSGPPWRRWADLDPGAAGALGWYAPQAGVSTGPTGRVLLAPGDIRNTVIEPALAGDTACCGLGGDEPNLVCTTCRTPVATRIDDCGRRQQTWLDPRVTRVVDDGPGPHPLLDWSQLIDRRPGVPPSEPDGNWHPLWVAATAAALAHALAASGGERVTIPDPQVADLFQPVLDRRTGTGTGSASTPATSRPHGGPEAAGPGTARPGNSPARKLPALRRHPQITRRERQLVAPGTAGREKGPAGKGTPWSWPAPDSRTTTAATSRSSRSIRRPASRGR